VSSKTAGDEGIELVRTDIKQNMAVQASDRVAKKARSVSVPGSGGKWTYSLPMPSRARPGLKGYGDLVPLRWFVFQEAIADLKQSGTARLSLDHTRDLAKKFGIGADSENGTDYELMLVLRTFTSAGILKHTDKTATRHVVIIDPQWLVNTLCELLSTRSISRNVFRA
jgi:hypothetical protein